jgi:hypothetical protein
MTKKRAWYQWLSNPSQVLLLVFIGLCLFFMVGLFRQIDDVRAHQAQLRYTLARRDALVERGKQLDEYAESVELRLEGLARDGYGARREDTVVQIPPEALVGVEAEPDWAPLEGPVWQQWWDLFFGSD